MWDFWRTNGKPLSEEGRERIVQGQKRRGAAKAAAAIAVLSLSIFAAPRPSRADPFLMPGSRAHPVIPNSWFPKMPPKSVKCNPTGSTAAVQDCANPLISGLTIHPSFQTTNQGLNILQDGPTTGSQVSSLFYNQAFCNSDNYTATGALGSSCLAIYYGLGGSNTGGSKQGLFVEINPNATPTSTNPFYAAGVFLTQTNDSVAMPSGTALDGIEIFAEAGAGATVQSVQGIEIEAFGGSGSSTQGRFGVSAISLGSAQGTLNTFSAPTAEDAAFHVGTISGVAWLTALRISHWNGAAPLDSSNGCVICTDGASDTIKSFADASTFTITGNIFNFANYRLDGNGKEFTLGSAPALTSCGSSPSINGTDRAGIIGIGGGGATTCTLTFAHAYTNAPFCVLSAQSGTAPHYARSASQIVISVAATADFIHYMCVGNQS
jgi:hypothetical protein